MQLLLRPPGGASTVFALLLPTGLVYNASDKRLASFATWANATGAIVRAWHPQSWALHMFHVASHVPATATL